MAKQRYRLKLSRLDFVSPVDTPAQETAKVCLIKRQGAERVAITARVAKVDEGLGLVFGWAFTSQVDGADYFDLQGDTIDESFVKAAAEFMQSGGLTDEMHDSQPDGRVVFCMPMTPEIAKAFGVVSKTIGLMVALKPSADVFAKFKSGEYTGFSIAGEGERTAVKSVVDKAQWSVAMIDDLPDSSFLYIEPGGDKDSSGKTTPRSLRHFPYRDENGKVDLDHLRNAISRIPQSSLAPTLRNKLQVKAEKLLAAQHQKRASLRKAVVLTDLVDGHQHALDTDDPASWCGDRLSTTYATSEGADVSHCHVWTFDPQSGEITIAADSGHDHTVDAVVPQDVLAAFALNERAEAAESAQQMLQQVLDGGAGMPPLNVSIAARFSTPPHAVNQAAFNTEKSTMATEHEKQIADLTKRAERAERIAKMSGAHKTHFDSLAGEDQEAFLSKSAAERDAVVAEIAKAQAAEVAKRNEVEYVADNGDIYRKSDDPRLVKLAKERDVERLAHRTEVLKRRAHAEIGHIAGSDDAKVALLKAVDSIADEKLRGEVLQSLKSADAFAKERTVAKGFNPGGDAAVEPQARWDAEVAKVAAENKISVAKATDMFANTEVGKHLYAEIHKAKRANA